ncbi:hypothetical protein DM826_02745 [Halonotius aquaticus]|uniref:Uncharacterized protein n=1 Tax=Halonotius aquaticus TaxID=2216978 RepID=A0A3A6PZ15_9EURY|nr:hypothetical protein DM826_02745 [Halonotius aquaticus]
MLVLLLLIRTENNLFLKMYLSPHLRVRKILKLQESRCQREMISLMASTMFDLLLKTLMVALAPIPSEMHSRLPIFDELMRQTNFLKIPIGHLQATLLRSI